MSPPPGIFTSMAPVGLSRLLAFVLFLVAPALARAQGPHEIALIVNQNSHDSIEIAHTYAHLRRIPPSNIIYLDLPNNPDSLRAEISLSDFQRLIYEPVQKELTERKLQDHILAWIYSADFPIRITTAAPISLTGATFVRGEVPQREQIDQGTFPSPFFRGPVREGETGGPAGSLQEFAVVLQDKMPLPSMMLGYTGARGLPAETILDGLRRAITADGTKPRDPVYFHLGDDVRSTARRWQFEGIATELKEIGIPSIISSNRPLENAPLSGLMLGTAYTADSWGRLQPGSIADNLTSLGAYFHIHEQTRISHWLAAGAAASAGTVGEPYANWRKFPHARIFAHYTRGCTALESYLQSVASPLQLLPVGDPLCRPWSRPIPLTLISLEDTKAPLSGIASFHASSLVPNLNILFLLDGRTVPTAGNTTGIRIDTHILSDGYHELTAVAYSPGPIRSQGLAKLGFTVKNRDQSAHIALAEGTATNLDLTRPIKLSIGSSTNATRYTLIVNERTLWEGPASPNDQTVTLPASTIGPGPARLQLLADFPNHAQVQSTPLPIHIQRLNRPPSPPSITVSNLADHTTQLTAHSADPDRDAVQITWFSDLTTRQLAGAKTQPALTQADDGTWTLATAGGGALVEFADPLPPNTRELTALIKTQPVLYNSGSQIGGIAFDIKDDQNYSCFGWHWEEGGWILGRVENGRLVRIATRGTPLNPRTPYRIGLRQSETKLTATIGDEIIAQTDKLQLRGAIGLSGGQPALSISQIAITPPSQTSPEQATSPTLNADPATPLLIRAADHATSSWTSFP